MYKLSPSDFAYLYEECKHCYYLKVRYKIPRPEGVFPAVFGAINARIQRNLIGHDLRELSPGLPEGIVESQEKVIRSIQIPSTNLYISGRYDLLVRQPDNTYMFIDLKLSAPKDEKITQYKTQLWSYAYAFGHPALGKPKRITRTGLLVFYPDSVKFSQGSALLSFPPTWLEVPIDEDGFLEFIREISSLVEGPTPAENPNCQWCKHRHLGEALKLPQTSDIPF